MEKSFEKCPDHFLHSYYLDYSKIDFLTSDNIAAFLIRKATLKIQFAFQRRAKQELEVTHLLLWKSPRLSKTEYCFEKQFIKARYPKTY